ALVIGEEECLVLFDRPPDRSAELVLLEGRLLSVEEPSCVELLVRRYSNAEPCSSFDPERVITLMTAPPVENSASVLATCILNSPMLSSFEKTLIVPTTWSRSSRPSIMNKLNDPRAPEVVISAPSRLVSLPPLVCRMPPTGPGVVPGTSSASCEKLRPFSGS